MTPLSEQSNDSKDKVWAKIRFEYHCWQARRHSRRVEHHHAWIRRLR